jgi:hypothetical protein
MRAALVALGLVAACGGWVPALPSQGGPAWIEIQSEHFTLWTDAGAGRGTELVEQMEYLHQIVFGVAFPTWNGDGRAFAIGLRDTNELHAYIPAMFGALSVPGDNPLHVPVIMFSADTSERDGHVLTHELTHVISARAIPDQPVWFAEGLAKFFETTRLDPSKADVDVGEPLPDQMMSARNELLVPGDELFACKRMECRDHRFYTTATLVLSYLENTHAQQLLVLEDHLARGEPSAQAWSAALPDLPIANLDRVVRAWEIAGEHRIWHFHVKLREPHLVHRTLADTDVLAIRAFLGASPKSIEAALAADPTNVIANLVTNYERKGISLPAARAVAQAHPDDWRAWGLVLEAHAVGDEAKIARAHACTLAARNAANLVPAKLCPSVHAVDAVPGGSEDSDQPVRPEQVP